MLLDKIKNAGIVGCGGAGFPTHVKLNCNVEYLIINGAECEPLLRTDRWLMLHKTSEIIDVITKIADMVSARKIYIALKETYTHEIEALQTAITQKNSRTVLYKMRNYYPAGDEQIMVCDITNRTVPPSGIPLDVGVVVSNLATVYAISQADNGESFTHKYLTMTGEVARPCILHTPVGTSFDECLQAAGGSLLSDYHVIAGGPMMGKCCSSEEAKKLSVTKTSSGFILVPSDAPLVKKSQIPLSASVLRAKSCCIQCSYCTRMCPRYLSGHPLRPHMIMRKLAYARSVEDVLDDTDVKQAMICSECGLCETYACPMDLQPRRINIMIKNRLREQNFRYEKPAAAFTELEERDYRRAPSKRMAFRLGVDRYYDYHIDVCREVYPEKICVSLKQHIGAPSTPVVSPGETVHCGQLIAAMPEKGLGANIHAGIDGTVVRITDSDIILSAKHKNGGLL